jgi:hypothetical protein
MSYPPWVPAAVREEADRLLCRYYYDLPPDTALIQRLAAAPEMAAVWKTLQRYPRPEASARHYRYMIPESPPDPLADFFHAAYFAEGEDAAYLAERAAKVDRWRELGARLRQEASEEYLFYATAHGDTGAGALRRAALVLEETAERVAKCLHHVPGKRARGHQLDRRGCAVAIASRVTDLFALPTRNALHTVVATVITMKFSQAGITNKHVAYWLDSYAKKQA